MAKLVGTLARVNPTTGVWEHKHEGAGGWHWASAGHRDNGQLHTEVKAATPVFPEATSEALKGSYGKALRRVEGYVSKIASAKGPAVLVKASKA